MSVKHTSGRISVREGGDANSYALTIVGGTWLLSLLHNGQQLIEKQRANMRRIAACWNACDGISTEALESGVVRELLEALQDLSSECVEAGLADASDFRWPLVTSKARAAITKVKNTQES